MNGTNCIKHFTGLSTWDKDDIDILTYQICVTVLKKGNQFAEN